MTVPISLVAAVPVAVTVPISLVAAVAVTVPISLARAVSVPINLVAAVAASGPTSSDPSSTDRRMRAPCPSGSIRVASMH